MTHRAERRRDPVGIEAHARTHRLPSSETEAEFQTRVVQLATLYGWAHMHVIAAMADNYGRWRTPTIGTLGRGWPDLTMVHRRTGRLIFAELKAEKGKLTVEQMDVLDLLRSTAAEVYVWRPSDFDELQRILR